MLMKRETDGSKLRTDVQAFVRTRTGGMIRDLRVDTDGGRVVLNGSTGSFYGKQLAGEAAMTASPVMPVRNQIAVRRAA